jgi:hypothetical protein
MLVHNDRIKWYHHQKATTLGCLANFINVKIFRQWPDRTRLEDLLMLEISFADFVYVTKFSNVGLDLPGMKLAIYRKRESAKRSAKF